MMLFSVVLPLAQANFLKPPSSSSGAGESGSLLTHALIPEVMFGIVLLAVLIVLLSRRTVRPRPAQALQNPILVDGSNVMHWKDETPKITTVQSVIEALKRRGFTPGVVFDANAGYKLIGRYMNERAFATLLTLPEDQIFVVPKGTQADPYLLDAARGFGARVVTRDRFRDWAEGYPEVKEPGFLIRGGYRDSGELWLDEALAVGAVGVKG